MALPDTHWLVSSYDMNIFRTTDGGQAFGAVDAGIDRTGASFYTRFVNCPNADVVIAGTDNLWRSNDVFTAAVPTWTSNGDEMGDNVNAMAFAPSDPTCNTYAFGVNNGQLRITFNGGATWRDLDAGNDVPNRAITDLAFDPQNSDILYVALSGFDALTFGQPGHLFKTVNASAATPTWVNVSPPIDLPHNAIAIGPDSGNDVYAGTDRGVWHSADAGVSWDGPMAGMPRAIVNDLEGNPQTHQILAFTYGRGAFRLSNSPIPTPTTMATPTPPAGAGVLQNGSFEDGVVLAFEQSAVLESRDFVGDRDFTWDNTVAHDGSRSVKIVAPDPAESLWLQTIPVRPQTLYRVSAWVKTDSVAHIGNGRDVGAHTNLGGLPPISQGVFGTSDWTQVWLEFYTGRIPRHKSTCAVGDFSGRPAERHGSMMYGCKRSPHHVWSRRRRRPAQLRRSPAAGHRRSARRPCCSSNRRRPARRTSCCGSG